jgi:hypothetical protein
MNRQAKASAKTKKLQPNPQGKKIAAHLFCPAEPKPTLHPDIRTFRQK